MPQNEQTFAWSQWVAELEAQAREVISASGERAPNDDELLQVATILSPEILRCFRTNKWGPPVANEDDLCDLYQGVLERLFHYRPPLDPKLNLLGLFYRYARSVKVDRYVRKKDNHHEPLPEGRENLVSTQGIESRPIEEVFEAKEKVDRLQRYLSTLPPEQRDSLYDRYYFGDAREEIRANYGLSIRQIKASEKQLSDAIQRVEGR